MNLALKDIRFNLARFLLTMAGVGLLISASIGMVGLYRGIVTDALLIIDKIGADLWIVQGGRAGPFAEGSAISSTIDRRVEGLAGVARVRRFTQTNQQFEFQGRTLRATLTGIDYPRDSGGWLSLAQGRHLSTGHFEAIADISIGLAIDDRVRLGQDDYTIVGITRAMVDALGDGLLFVSVNDAVTIAQRRTSEEVLLARTRPVHGVPLSIIRAPFPRTARLPRSWPPSIRRQIPRGLHRPFCCGGMPTCSARPSSRLFCSTNGSGSCVFRYLHSLVCCSSS